MCYVLGRVVADGPNVASARAAVDDTRGAWQVVVTFTPETGWGRILRAHWGDELAAVLNGTLITVAKVNAGTSGTTFPLLAPDEQRAKSEAAALQS